MPTSVELARIMNRLGLSTQARITIQALQPRPSQRLRVDSCASIRVYPGTKIVSDIQVEKYRVDLPILLDMEYDPDVLAYWHRPAPLKRAGTLADGYTPTSLAIRRGGAMYEDWVDEDELRKGAAMIPGKFVRTVDGRWRFPAAEAAAAACGLGYTLRSSAEANPYILANLDFLAGYYHVGKRLPRVNDALANTLVDVVRRRPGITIDGLRREVEPRLEAEAASLCKVTDAINILIIRQRLYVNLRGDRLSEPHRARLYADEATAYAIRCIASSLGPGPRSLAPPAITAAGREIFLKATRKDLTIANERFRALYCQVVGAWDPSSEECELPRSTWFRLMRRYREAARRYGAGYIGLLPAYGNCGRRQPRYDESITALIRKCVIEYYASPCRPTLRAAHNQLQAACKQVGLPCPGYAYFSKAVRSHYELMPLSGICITQYLEGAA